MQSGYLLDGSDIGSTYGVYVQKTKGALDFLKRKGEVSQSWLDSNGETAFVSADDIFFEPRDIILICHIKASSKAAFLTNLNAFKAVLEGAGLHTLKLPFLDDALSVYYKDGGIFSMLTTWTAATLVGKFIIKLREPLPATA